jgi:hypothetical protein
MVHHKKRFILVAVAVLLFVSVNTFLFFTRGYANSDNLSGMLSFNLGSSDKSLTLPQIAFVAQWIIALIVISVAYFKYVKSNREEKVKMHYIEIKEKHGKSNTDLDALYSILKKNKSLKIATISKIFNMDKEKALEWAKILENNNLAQIDYPAFSDPEITLKNEETPQQ